MSTNESESTAVAQALEATPYSCKTLQRLSGGSVNFVFRGELQQPVRKEDGTLAKSVVIKFSKGYLPGNTSFLLDISRCSAEASVLEALEQHVFATVRTPQIYLFNSELSIQVMEDMINSEILQEVVVSQKHSSREITTQAFSETGFQVGSWLRAFHAWGSASSQHELRNKIFQDSAMRKFKRKVKYDRIMEIVKKFPDTWREVHEDLEALQQLAIQESECTSLQASEKDPEAWGVIHGDFWSGNILVEIPPPAEGSIDKPFKSCIIDWEFVQFGHRAYDFGELIGDLYERVIFNDAQSPHHLIDGLIRGYGPINSDMAFRTAIHAGVQVLGWYIRRHPDSPVTGTPAQIDEAIKFGTDCIVKGLQKDEVWFKGSILAKLFE